MSIKKGLISLDNEDYPGREVYVIRHGQTKLNAENKIRGWSDVPLDDVGQQQAIELGEALLDEHIELDGIFSSDLLRALQTTLAVSRVTGIPLLGSTKNLRPMDVGDLTGTDGKKAHDIIGEHARNAPDVKVGGGESFDVFRTRFLTGIIGILNTHRGLRLGLTSHSRGERILHAWIAAGCPDDLSVDLDEFLRKGEEPATAQQLFINSNLVLQ